MNEINIIDYIPIGHENGISKDNLSMVTGLPERAVRKAINDHNASGKEPICNVSDGCGYFIDNTEDKRYLNICIRQESSRARDILTKVGGMKTYLLSCGGVE